ncbi:winged helix-turn-helix domain-containing protein (plasmid) [Streptomyces clavuligerus]|nr:hypothetical protein D1794_31540 [Streptomyces clavuligerus]MBY6307189.1 winged helix-turn-helix domain-containing protein [Streptomyces clavuligerus]QCS10233.1 hypothetical protein CRV15_32235 [Streptomyces clavuligerus]QPJ97720.1 hypothetical protein GE265_32220 [Streptomyces clavuligerus]QPL67232.1 winged helix-turn-helix domain-containing protein [Streptomyces clavuligerus]
MFQRSDPTAAPPGRPVDRNRGVYVEFQLLGPVEVRDEGRPIALSGSKMHTALAALLLARGRVVSDERLSELLWGLRPPATRNAQIYTHISRLRQRLGPSVGLTRRQPGYRLVTDGAHVDAFEFERLERLGRTALEERRFAQAASVLRRALDLWQGPALGNVTPYLAEVELPRFEEARMSVLEDRIGAELALGRHGPLTSELTWLVGEFPLRERLRAQLMTALYRCGRQAEALHVYHEGREVLTEELGVDPGSDLTAAYQAVLSRELDNLPQPARVVLQEPPAGAAAPLVTLPSATADFTGRTAELDQVRERLAPSPGHRPTAFGPRRLLVSGMPGVGKTALAVQAAHTMAEEFPDGLLHLRLRAADGTPADCGDVLTGLLRQLGESPERLRAPDGDRLRLDDLIHRCRTLTAGRKLLVLLDDAVNELQLEPLLPATADAAVLVTSRNQFSMGPGSWTVTLEPLTTEESFGLLAAVIGDARVRAEPEAAREVVEACARLPLALRAAATRLAVRPHWPVARLARRLADPAARLAELRVGTLDVRRVLSAALGRRQEREVELIHRLVHCADGEFTASQAALPLFGLPGEVAEERAEDFLERLVEASLLEAHGVDGAGAPRYRFHPLLRLTVAPARPALSALSALPTAAMPAMPVSAGAAPGDSGPAAGRPFSVPDTSGPAATVPRTAAGTSVVERVRPRAQERIAVG